jgi:hypothetical protein
MSSTLSHQPPASAASRPLRRLAAVLAAILMALALWVIATHAIGINLRSPAFGPAKSPTAVTAAMVAVASGLAGLAAWGLLAMIERTSRRPRQIWTAIALTALLLSLAAPLSGHGISGANRIVLGCLHVVVAATLITLLGRSAAGHESINRPPDHEHQPGPAGADATSR